MPDATNLTPQSNRPWSSGSKQVTTTIQLTGTSKQQGVFIGGGRLFYADWLQGIYFAKSCDVQGRPTGGVLFQVGDVNSPNGGQPANGDQVSLCMARNPDHTFNISYIVNGIVLGSETNVAVSSITTTQTTINAGLFATGTSIFGQAQQICASSCPPGSGVHPTECGDCSWPQRFSVDVEGVTGGSGRPFSLCNGVWHAEHLNAFGGPTEWEWPGSGDPFHASPPCNGIIVPNPKQICLSGSNAFQLPYLSAGGSVACQPNFNTIAINDAQMGSQQPVGTFHVLQSCAATSIASACLTASIFAAAPNPALRVDPNGNTYDYFVSEAQYGPLDVRQIQCLEPFTLPLLWAIVFSSASGIPGALPITTHPLFSVSDGDKYVVTNFPSSLTFIPA